MPDKATHYSFPFFNQHVKVPEMVKVKVDASHASHYADVRHCIGLIVTNLLALGEVAYSRNSNFYTEHGTRLFTFTSMMRAVDAAVASGWAVRSREGYRAKGYRTGLSSTIAPGRGLAEFGAPVKLELDVESLPFMSVDKKSVFDEVGLSAVESRTVRAKPESVPLLPRLKNFYADALRLNRDYWNRIQVGTGNLPIGTVCMGQVGLTRLFKQGGVGRWFQRGGMSYQELSKRDRARLLLDGEPVVELDYHAMHPHILYAWAGEQCPDDFYESIVQLSGCPRDAVKELVLVAVNASSYKSLSSAVNSTQRRGAESSLYAQLKELGLTARDAVGAIVQAHPRLERYVFTSQANRLMLAESDIITAVIVKLMGLGIPSLPVHDSVIAPDRHRATVKRLMEEEYRRQTGFDIAEG